MVFAPAPEEAVYLPVSGEVTSALLARELDAAAERAGSVTVLDLKSLLKMLPVREQDVYFDAGVAAYLLNPLKSSYGYEDLARDYLHQTVPAPSEILGKTPLAEAAPEVFREHVPGWR